MVVPTDVLVDQGKHLVAGTLLPMPGIDGFRLHPSEEAPAAALSGEQPLAPVDRAGPYRSMSAGHPGHRQWWPRSERTRGCVPSGSVSAAVPCFASIFLKQFLHYFSVVWAAGFQQELHHMTAQTRTGTGPPCLYIPET